MATVLEKLRNEGNLASTEWVDACLTWLDQNEPNLSPAHKILKVQEQWLSADLTAEGIQESPCLPEGLSEQVKCRLPGRYFLQVQYGYDIGNPAYGQLQKLRQVDVENQRVSADDSQASQGVGNQTQGEGGYQATQGGRFQAAWEPKPSRMMFLTLTDGFQMVQAMEHEREPKIPDKISPGAKIELRGPLICRRGIILISKNSFRLLGGEVEDLAPTFNLEKILGEKIGRTEDHRGEFAQFMSENNRNAPNVPKRQVAPSRNVPQAGNIDMTGDDFDDMGDDEDLLLLAASQIDMAGAVTSTQIPNKPKKYHQTKINANAARPNVNIDMTGDSFDDEDDDEALLMAASQVDISAPSTSNLAQPMQKPIKPKNYQQTKIDPANLFPKPKMPPPPPRAPLQQKHANNPFIDDDDEDDFSQPTHSTDIAQFDLMDDDDELFNSIPEAAVEPEAKQVPDVPFTYLLHMKQTMEKFPTRRLVKTVKAVITTLSSKMSIQKTDAGPVWHVSVMLNDGTASLQADISDALLSSRIGSASAYLAIPASDTETKARTKGRMKEVSQWLATVSGLFSIRVETGIPMPLVEDIAQVGGLHLAQLRRRRLQ